MNTRRSPHARGSVSNPKNRFERLEYVPDSEDDAEAAGQRTVFLRDDTQAIIAHNKSPDVGFESSINVYRGCEHGCSCFANS